MLYVHLRGLFTHLLFTEVLRTHQFALIKLFTSCCIHDIRNSWSRILTRHFLWRPFWASKGTTGKFFRNGTTSPGHREGLTECINNEAVYTIHRTIFLANGVVLWKRDSVCVLFLALDIAKACTYYLLSYSVRSFQEFCLSWFVVDYGCNWFFAWLSVFRIGWMDAEGLFGWWYTCSFGCVNIDEIECATEVIKLC